MSAGVLEALNLFLNGIGSFVLGWLLAIAAERLFRVQPGRAQVALRTLPFAKVAFDAARGIPADSFLWLRARGTQQDMGSFEVGFGFKWCFPIIHFVLGAVSRGHVYAQSFGDLFAAFLMKGVSRWAPGVLVTLLIAVGAARLGIRAHAFSRTFAKHTEKGTHLFDRKVGWRTVRVYVSDRALGSPFTSGLVRPYVCFPRAIHEALSPDEREAALLHELGHIAHWDVAIVTLVGIVEDVFWFVPGIGRASMGVRRGCELAADAWAVRLGATRIALASALVRLGEMLATGSAVPSPSLALGGSILSARVTELLRGPRRARLGFQNRFGRIAILTWVGAVAALSVLLGNH